MAESFYTYITYTRGSEVMPDGFPRRLYVGGAFGRVGRGASHGIGKCGCRWGKRE